jgi:hypothetical protein
LQRLRRHILAGLLLFPLLVLAGCGGGGGGGGGTGTTVAGRILDSARNDQPVASAVVEIGGATTTTGTDGAFTLRGARVGSSTATVRAPGVDAQTIALPTPVTEGSNGPFDLIINIGQIRGRVLTAQNQPASGALVTVIATGDNVTTGADGTFQIEDLPAVETEVTAVLGTASATKTVTIANGVTEAGDLTLVNDPNPNPPGQPNTIVGTVRSAVSNATLANVVVQLLQNGVERERTATDAAGNYGFYVPVGTYVLRASGTGVSTVEGTATVTNPAQPVRLDFTLQP